MPALLEANCPRCGTKKITFDATAEVLTGVAYDWQRRYEVFAVCRRCHNPTIFILHQSEADPWVREHLLQHGLLSKPGSLNDWFTVEGYISQKDEEPVQPPEHLPEDVKAAFVEGTKCLAIRCYNAAGTMFRLAIDLATRSMLPPDTDTSISYKQRRDLGLRLPWLFTHQRLPMSLQELSSAVREDGNDGAHHGTLIEADAQDLLDFAVALLERIYTEPERIKAAKIRREQRRNPPTIS
ncbi:MAG TPA: DUF4145 domain-containing protein [Steroidobacteraceae bacterium]|jgi:hypothetical protein|nr:DUF4145 domain-containing protein [Steroidobacteraceae bacterium]